MTLKRLSHEGSVPPSYRTRSPDTARRSWPFGSSLRDGNPAKIVLTRFVSVTGGVASSLGKGIAAGGNARSQNTAWTVDLAGLLSGRKFSSWTADHGAIWPPEGCRESSGLGPLPAPSGQDRAMHPSLLRMCATLQRQLIGSGAVRRAEQRTRNDECASGYHAGEDASSR